MMSLKISVPGLIENSIHRSISARKRVMNTVLSCPISAWCLFAISVTHVCRPLSIASNQQNNLSYAFSGPLLRLSQRFDYALYLIIVNLNSSPNVCSKRMDNIEKLSYIHENMQRVHESMQYLHNVGERTSKFLLSKLQLPITYGGELSHPLTTINQLEQAVRNLEDKELSILSPKIFNILPSRRTRLPNSSPTILSFQDEGFIPLPRMLSVKSFRSKYT